MESAQLRPQFDIREDIHCSRLEADYISTCPVGSGARHVGASVATHALNGADAPWSTFSSHDYWRRNYSALQAEDQEIIRRVSHFFKSAFADRPLAQRAIDVGSGTNLYPALLMLPWTERLLLTDFSASKVEWLREQLANDTSPWTWQPFWGEMREVDGYRAVDTPRSLVRQACASEPGSGGIEQRSVFELPRARWDLGTMFFVPESITKDPEEFRTAVACFVGALKTGAPFAMAFMAGSAGYPVGRTRFPALPVSVDVIRRHLAELGATDLSVQPLQAKHRVRDGYAGMIVATGFANAAGRSTGPTGAAAPVGREIAAAFPVPRVKEAAPRVKRVKEEVAKHDVFLSYNRRDKDAVRGIAQRLRDRGLRPWMDERQLRPGLPWLRELEEVIAGIPAAAVIIGTQRSHWQDKEIEALLIQQSVSRNCVIVPALLPGTSQADLPVFLQGHTWVDLGVTEPDPIDQLVWGITGRQPYS